MIEVDHHINAVRRTVGDRTLEEGEVRVVTISRSYPIGAGDLCTVLQHFEGIALQKGHIPRKRHAKSRPLAGGVGNHGVKHVRIDPGMRGQMAEPTGKTP